jgi:hypothetical protein
VQSHSDTARYPKLEASKKSTQIDRELLTESGPENPVDKALWTNPWHKTAMASILGNGDEGAARF